MRGLLLISLCFLLSLNCFADIQSTLSKGLREAATGKLSDASLILSLREIYSESNSISNKVMAGYLLTFVEAEPTEKLKGYVRFVLSRSDSSRILGQEAMQRMRRFQGDFAFEKGKFGPAIEAYKSLLTAAGSMSSYAHLRLGWCYMNLERADLAYQLWLSHVRDSLNGERAPTPTLLHGLGQSLTEHLERAEGDFQGLAALKLNDEQQQAIAKGMSSGLYYLQKSSLITEWIGQLKHVPFRAKVIAAVFDSTNAKGVEACQLVQMLDIYESVKLKYESYESILKACMSSIEGKRKGALKYASMVQRVLPRLMPQGTERHLRFSYYDTQKHWRQACRDGMSWVIEESKKENKANIPARRIIAVCSQSVKRHGQVEVNSIVNFLHAQSLKLRLFDSVTSPMLYLVSDLIKDNAFLLGMNRELNAYPKVYAGSKLPVLLAETLLKQSKLVQAATLRELFARESESNGEAVWHQILVKRVAELIESNQLQAAKKMLDDHWPANKAVLDAEGFQLWASLADRVYKQKNNEAWVTTTHKLLLASEEIANHPRIAESLMETGAEQSLWTEVWICLKRLPAKSKGKVISDKLSMTLFHLVAAGKLDVTGWKSLPHRSVRELLQIAVMIKEKGEKGVESKALSASKGSLLRSDVIQLKGIDRRKRRALRKSKDSINQIQRWVSFLDYASKRFRKLRWVSAELYEVALEDLSDFNKRVLKASGSLRKPKVLSPEQWGQVVANFQDRVNECQVWVSSTNVEGLERNKATKGSAK